MRRLLIPLVALFLLPATAHAVTFTSDATVTNKDYGTEQVVVDGAHVTFDNVHWGAFNATPQTYEGRLTVIHGGLATVKNSKLGPGGCSDGIMANGGGGAWGNIDVTNTEIVGLRQGSCGPHVDAVQLYGGHVTNFSDNYIHDSSTGVMGYDYNGQIDVFKNNVLVGDEYHDILLISANTGGLFANNVVIGKSFEVNRSTGNTIRDNVIDDLQSVNGSSNTTSGNVPSSQVTFKGGTGRCAYAATSGTAGLNDCAGGPPPPPPPPDNTPVARFTASPEPSAPGQAVTFNATASTCDDTPCTYAWADDGPDGPGGSQWPLGSGQTLSFTFQETGTKWVRLTVTDADGDTDTVEHDHVVSSAPPPDTTPPDTTITSLVQNDVKGNVVWYFTSSEAGSTFECKHDAYPFEPCTTSTYQAYTGQGYGSHTFAVRATDAAGNVDATPAVGSWTRVRP